MGKVKIISQEKKTSELKKPRFKKERKRKSNKQSLNSIHKNELTKSNTSTNVQKSKKKKEHNSKTKLVAKNTEKSNNSTTYLKGDKKIKVFQNTHTNPDNKLKYKKNKRQKPRQTNDIAKANASTEKNSKKLKMSANRSKYFDHRKIQNIEKMNQKKIKQMSNKTETQQVESEKTLKLNKHKIKLSRLKEMLADKPKERKVKKVAKPLTMRDRMMTQLRASRFRFINETLYNNESSQSKQYFKEDPDAFKAYHDGYKLQLERWPINPLDIIISSIKKMSTENVIADFGCGEALLATSVPHKVHSFDFIALNDRVKACDMAHTPLLMNSVHVVVFCLSLMGSNLADYIMEANRVLKTNGTLKIAEVESRFENVMDFIKLLTNYGFKNTWKDLSHDLFHFMDFKKEADISMKKKNLPSIILKPCLYKKR